MQRSVLPVSVLLLSGLAIYACGSDTLAPTELGVVPGPSGSVTALSGGSDGQSSDDSPLQRGRADKVDVCHYQPGDGVWRKISVGQSSLRGHLESHDDLAGPPGTTAQTTTALDASCGVDDGGGDDGGGR